MKKEDITCKKCQPRNVSNVTKSDTFPKLLQQLLSDNCLLILIPLPEKLLFAILPPFPLQAVKCESLDENRNPAEVEAADERMKEPTKRRICRGNY